jgi:hypothetical protein
MLTSEILSAALALIDTPDKWCQGMHNYGSARCSVKAIYDAASMSGRLMAKAELDAIRSEINGRSIGIWNDTPGRAHATVVAVFRRAIAAEQAKEAA